MLLKKAAERTIPDAPIWPALITARNATILFLGLRQVGDLFKADDMD